MYARKCRYKMYDDLLHERNNCVLLAFGVLSSYDLGEKKFRRLSVVLAKVKL